MKPRAFDRAASLAALRSEEFDLVVIGGGVTGAGVVLDAASRGLKAALVERTDFAAGTSSKSSKLVHGGLRYLQNGEVHLVYEALAERQRLLRNAPHLVRVLPFLIPIMGKDGVVPAKLRRAFGSALWLYDLTGGARIGKLHRHIGADDALTHMPTLRRDRLRSAYVYYDASADDARLTLTLSRTAAIDHGAVIANRAKVVGIGRSEAGRANAVLVEADGETFEVRTRAIVNATGVWADDIRSFDGQTGGPTIRPAKGIHITVPWALVRNDIAAVIPVPGDTRSVFVVPWGDLTYIGTTDTDYDGPIDDPRCTPEDVNYLLSAISAATGSEFGPEDVVGSWAGLRPLVANAGSAKTADLSRRHTVRHSDSGIVTIAGGKLTTYRRMAADTVDAVVDTVLLRDVPARARRSRTRKLRLRGAAGFETVLAGAAEHPGVDPAVVTHLARRYGGEARVLIGLIQQDPTLAEPLVEGLPYVSAEAVFAVREEMAQTLDDVLSRRTRARLLQAEASAAAAPRVAALIGAELGWNQERVEAEARSYIEAVNAERAEAGISDDPFDLDPAVEAGLGS